MTVLYAYVRLPDFPLERCGYGPEEHLALWEVQHQIARVTVVAQALAGFGIQPGMSSGEARALCHDIVLLPRDLDEEREDRAQLTATLHRWGDRVRQDGDDGWILEVRGLMSLYGGPEGLLDQLRRQLQGLGHRVQVALAEHPMAARVLATAGAAPWSEAGAAHRLAGLPLQALPASEAWLGQLLAVGCRTLGDVAALDPASVAARYGPEGLKWHQVLRGAPGEPWGSQDDLQEHPGVRLRVEAELSEGEALLHVILEGVRRLRTEWLAREVAPEALRLELRLADGTVATRVVRRHGPSRREQDWRELWQAALGSWQLSAPVVEARLWPLGLAAVDPDHLRCGARRTVHEPFDQLVARMRLTLGAQGCVQVQSAPAWLPEDRWREASSAVEASRRGRRDPVEAQEAWRFREDRPLPPRLRARPRPVQIQVEDDVPAAIRGLRSWAPLQLQEGPVQVRGGWWRPGGGEERRYYRMGSPRGDLSLFESQGRWFHQGWFD